MCMAGWARGGSSHSLVESLNTLAPSLPILAVLLLLKLDMVAEQERRGARGGEEEGAVKV